MPSGDLAEDGIEALNRIEAARNAEMGAEITLEQDAAAGPAATIEGKRGNPLALIVLTAVNTALQIVQAAYDNAEGPSFNADNYDPTERYGIVTSSKYFTTESKSGEIMKFQLKDITLNQIVPTNLE
jgi:hypothetical protein